MALDNANFISELSIVDPPGTDPLSQGDDQIRTIKRATQQSFPNIGAAVTKTADEMNLMAILNANQTFTGNNTFQDVSITIDMVIDSPKALQFNRSGTATWQLNMDNDAGNNNLRIRRFDVLGALVDLPWSIDGVTGIVDFAQVPTVQGAPLWIAGEIRMFAITAVPGTNWFLADGLNGTVDMTDRALIATGASSVGTALAPNLVAQVTSSVSGSTAITEAQMPSHAHDPWVSNDQSGGVTDIGLNALTVWGFGGRRNDATRHYDNRRSGGLLINPAGSGQGHTHTTPTAVVENGVDRQTVRPLSRVVQMFQYVP